MREWRKQELAVGLIIGIITLLTGTLLIVLNLRPPSANAVVNNNVSESRLNASLSPTPTFTATPQQLAEFEPEPTRRIISAIPQGNLGSNQEDGQLSGGENSDGNAAVDEGTTAVEIVIPSTIEPTATILTATEQLTQAPEQVLPTDVVATLEPTAVAVTPTSELPTPFPTATTAPPTATPISADVNITINADNVVNQISPYIYGLSHPDSNILTPLRPTGISWGGNPSSRYNWREGNYWNSARDYEWRNGTFGMDGMVADYFLKEAMANDMVSRLTVPTLGWVAKDWWSCSFTDEDGNCQTIDHFTDCDNPTVLANPYETSVPSTPSDIREWMEHIRDSGLDVTYIAMDNEPELWGFSHFDVHPNCTTYQEILDKYTSYAEVVADVLPETDLVGPATCCWHFYWQSAAGLEDKAKHGYQDFLPWFLSSLRQYEVATGKRLLDVLDIHYYPEGLYQVNSEPDDAEREAHRLRSVRSLWDPSYVDESWVNEPVVLLPRMQALIDEYYPGTRFGISEWNFGQDHTVAGALALADALGQFGLHNVEYAFYWRYPDWDTPGYNAFRMFTNYDWAWGHYGDQATATTSDDINVSAYSALNSETGNLHIMLINKYPDQSPLVGIDVEGFSASPSASMYRYDTSTYAGIVEDFIELEPGRLDMTLTPYSITQIILMPDSQ